MDSLRDSDGGGDGSAAAAAAARDAAITAAEEHPPFHSPDGKEEEVLQRIRDINKCIPLQLDILT